MKIVVIYDTPSKNNIYNCVQKLLHILSLNTNIIVTEFFIPRNYFNSDCFSKSHSDLSSCSTINLLTNEINKADLFILVSKVINCDLNSNMKKFLRNLNIYYSKYNSIKSPKKKIALSMVFSSSAGLHYVSKVLKNNFSHLGIVNIIKFQKTFFVENTKVLNWKERMLLNRHLFKLSFKILKAYHKKRFSKFSIFNYIFLPNKNKVQINRNPKAVEFNCWKCQSFVYRRKTTLD